jgi:hypothetical protein
MTDVRTDTANASLTSSATSSLFDVPEERARSFIKWAKYLAIAEGLMLALSAYMIAARPTPTHTTQLAGGIAALAVISIFLGWQTGRGSTASVVVLLGLAASRGVTTYLGNAPEWWSTWPGITLLELWVFGQGVRGAIALGQEETRALRRRVEARHLAERQARAQAEGPVAAEVRVKPQPVVEAMGSVLAGRPSSQTPVPSRPKGDFVPLHLEPFDQSAVVAPDFSWARSPLLDLVVVGVVALYSVKLMSTPVIHSEGLQGFAESTEVAFGFLNMVFAVLLLIGSRGAAHGKRWGIRLRRLVYVTLGLEVMAWIKLKI